MMLCANLCSIPFAVINFVFCLGVVSCMQCRLDDAEHVRKGDTDSCDGRQLPLLLSVLLTSVAMAAFKLVTATDLIRLQAEHQAYATCLHADRFASHGRSSIANPTKRCICRPFAWKSLGCKRVRPT